MLACADKSLRAEYSRWKLSFHRISSGALNFIRLIATKRLFWMSKALLTVDIPPNRAGSETIEYLPSISSGLSGVSAVAVVNCVPLLRGLVVSVDAGGRQRTPFRPSEVRCRCLCFGIRADAAAQTGGEYCCRCSLKRSIAGFLQVHIATHIDIGWRGRQFGTFQ